MFTFNFWLVKCDDLMNPNTISKWIFGLHVFAYLSAWMLLVFIMFMGSYNSGFLFAVMAAWGVPMSLHAFWYAYNTGLKSGANDERKIYREGFADGILEARNLRDERVNGGGGQKFRRERKNYLYDDLVLGEDGELYDESEYEKHKRR